MKVFATQFLEKMSSDQVGTNEIWNWAPTGENAEKIFASGANTSSQTSTYAAEKDSRSDSDRPNEGMFVAQGSLAKYFEGGIDTLSDAAFCCGNRFHSPGSGA